MKSRLSGRRPARPGIWLLVTTAALSACSLGPNLSEAPSAPSPPSSEAGAAGAAEAVAPRLEAAVGAVAEAEVDAGERHVFPLTLEEGTYLEVHVDRPDHEIEVHLFDPGVDPQAGSGDAYVSGEPATGHDGQMLWEVTRAAGEHHLRVDGGERPATYRLEVVALRPATERDWSRHRGMRMYEQGDGLQRAHRSEDALEKFAEARELFVRGEYERGVGATYSREGKITKMLGRRDEARVAYREAAEHWRLGGDVPSEISSWTLLARMDREAGDWESAERHLEIAAARAREEGNAEALGLALTNYCRFYRDLGRVDRALETCRQALDVREASGIAEEVAPALIVLGQVHSDRGELDRSRELYLRALEIVERHPNAAREATLRNDLGVLYQAAGEYLKALLYFQQALEIHERTEGGTEAARVIFNLGTTHARLGSLDKTLELYLTALHRMKAADDRIGTIEVLLGIAWAEREMGRLAEAQQTLSEALDLSRGAENEPLLAYSLQQIGEMALEAGEFEKALESLQSARRLYENADYQWQVASILRRIAAAHAALGRDDRALEILQEAVDLNRTIGKRSGTADGYFRMARLHHRRGDLDAALEAITRALEVVEQIRGTAGAEELQAIYSATVEHYHDLKIEILVEMHLERPGEGFSERAFYESELSKAQSLREIIVEADLQLEEQVPEALVRERIALRNEIETHERRRQSLLSSGTPAGEALFRTRLDLETALTRLQEVERRIRETSPRYAALTDPDPLSVAFVQSELLDAETALLEFNLGANRSYLWVITSDSFHLYPLPGREVVEAEARCLHRLLTAYGDPPPGSEVDPDLASCLGEQLGPYERVPIDRVPIRTRGQRRREIELAFDRTAARLAEMLLGDVHRDVSLPLRLALVSDGALEYVPFSALPIPADAERSTTESRLLVEEHEIVRLPSASVLAVQRRQRRAPEAPPPGLLAVVADPVYGPEDPRVRAGGHLPPARAEEPAGTEDEGESEIPFLRRLDLSGQEASAILSLVADDRALLIESFDARRDRLLQGDLGSYGYVHFATHGQIDTQYPKLSSLVLSRVDETGRVIDSGHFRLQDIYGLDLDDVDMVVLSACETALGREVRGEGLMGLTRGFLYAGADRVAATLWQVQDVMTAELMKRFYFGLFDEDRAPADALRRAQLAVREADGGAHSFPYYWAGFVLQGEWR